MSSTLDGNVLAGALREVFAVDVTTARAECAGAGRSARSERSSSMPPGRVRSPDVPAAVPS